MSSFLCARSVKGGVITVKTGNAVGIAADIRTWFVPGKSGFFCFKADCFRIEIITFYSSNVHSLGLCYLF